MTPLAVMALALAMSADAFAAAVAKGAAIRHPRWVEALRTGLIFGVIEGVTPLVGWSLGRVSARYIEAWDHWIAFLLLCGLGLHMLASGAGTGTATSDRDTSCLPARHPFWLLAATGFATSIDAMAIGVGLAFLDVPIIPIALTIGCTTIVMATLGVMVGHVLGAVAGKRAEIVGGLLLIAIGCTILVDHLGL